MAKAKKRASTRPSSGGRARPGSRQRQSATRTDAITLLTADHRQVETWFEQFESTRSEERKQNLARQICQALKIHTRIEEEIFYPAFLDATGETDIHHEAEIEHNGAKELIGQIESSGSDDEYFVARMSVLSDMIQHHVEEEEKRDGMFGRARKAKMDLQALGEQLAARKRQLAEDEETVAPRASARRAQDAHF